MIERRSIRQKLQRWYFHLYENQKYYFEARRMRRSLEKKIRERSIFKTAPKDQNYLSSCREFLQKNFYGYSNTNSHFYFSTVRGKKEINIIPEDIYYTRIEPVMNELQFYRAYNDKVSLDLFFRKDEMPATIFKIIQNQFFDSDHNLIGQQEAIALLLAKKETVVLKPAILSGGGRDVVIDNGKKIAERLNSNPNYKIGSYIIQEKAQQHSEMAKFHPPSLNTCRVMTARVGSDIVVLSSYFRVGKDNSTIDNGQSGGLMCRISDEGKLDRYAWDVPLNAFEVHPDTGLKFHNFTVPFYSKVKDFCTNKHNLFLRYTFISWDIGVDKNGQPIFIEFNFRKQSIHGHQVINGPIFGKYTDEILAKYKELREKDPFYI